MHIYIYIYIYVRIWLAEYGCVWLNIYIYIYIYIYISNVSIDWYMREKQRGMISSNSRSQTVPKLILLIETM